LAKKIVFEMIYFMSSRTSNLNKITEYIVFWRPVSMRNIQSPIKHTVSRKITSHYCP